MDSQEDFQPDSDVKSARGHHRSRGSASQGRATIAAIFLMLTAIQIGALQLMPGIYFKTPQMVAEVLLSTLWTGTLLGAVWNRQDWARYVLIVALVLTAICAVIFAPMHFEISPLTIMNKRFIGLLAAYATGQIVAALILARSPHIKRLVSRSWE